MLSLYVCNSGLSTACIDRRLSTSGCQTRACHFSRCSTDITPGLIWHTPFTMPVSAAASSPRCTTAKHDSGVPSAAVCCMGRQAAPAPLLMRARSTYTIVNRTSSVNDAQTTQAQYIAPHIICNLQAREERQQGTPADAQTPLTQQTEACSSPLRLPSTNRTRSCRRWSLEHSPTAGKIAPA